MSETIFVSSVQKELAEERQAIRNFVRGDALLRRFFEVFLFEDLPASDRRADGVYIDQVGRCPIYVGLFGNEYGNPDASGLSPTEREFDRATASGKVRFVFVKGTDDEDRHPKMRALIVKAGEQVIRRRFMDVSDLTATLYASLVEHLERTGRLRTRPFDAAACPDAALRDLAREKVADFLARAQAERGYVLGPKTALSARARRAPGRPSLTSSRARSSPKRLSMLCPTVTTPATPACRSCSSPTVSRSGTPVNCRRH